MTNEQIAKVAHMANRAYCEALGDFSQQPWEDAPAWQRVSASNGVAFVKEHPCFVPFAELPPEQQAKDRLFRSIVLALAS